MMTNVGRLALAAALLTGTGLATGSALAQGRGAIAQHCREDLQKFCSGIQPGGGRLKPCVTQNYKKFSNGCQAALRDMVAERKQQQPTQ